MIAKTENLKPCPFCGGEVCIADMGDYWSVTRGHHERTACRCRVFMESEVYDTRNDIEEWKKVRENARCALVEAWNRRVCLCGRKEEAQ